MLKAFISHSSKQKEEFVEPLVELLGRDACIVDAYDFEAAYKSLDEIYRNIDKCSIFVFLVTKESLESEWCKKELEHSYQKLSAGDKMRFWPFIIDEKVKIKDTPEWINKTNCYNLRYFKTPIALAREIEQKFRSIIWKENPALQRKETLLVGRNSDIDLFESKIFSSRRNKLRAVIISGRVGVGKEAFANQCMQKIGRDVETIPFRLSLSAKDGVEDFILELNAITGTYSKEQMEEIVLPSSVNEKSHYAVLLLNELYKLRTVLYLQDDMCFVLPNRKLPDWFVDVIKDKDLNSQIGLFILSRLTPIATIESIFPEIISVFLGPLSKADRRKLFYQLLTEYNITNIADEDVEEIIEQLNQSPVQLIQFADSLRSLDYGLVKGDLDLYINLGDRKLRPLYEMFTDENERELIIVLSKFDYVSFSVLERIYGVDYDIAVSCVRKLIVNGLASTFGPSSCFVRLDSALSDFIKRNDINLLPDFENAINDILDDYLTDNPNMDSDLSVYMYNIRKRIVSGRTTDKDYLIPSVVVKSILELYNKGCYDEVIRLCKFVLSEFDNYDTDVVREIRYWLCLALCRRQLSDDFYKEVSNFDGADYKFLRGFYYRIGERPDLAERFYHEALDIAPSMQKLKREYVSALLEQRKFTEALDKAKENYEFAPDNTYHIHAYFRSLIKKTSLTRDDISELGSLISQVDKSYSPKKTELVCAMKLEYDIIIEKKPVPVILDKIKVLEGKFPNSHDIGRVISEFRFKQGITNHRDRFKEDYYY